MEGESSHVRRYVWAWRRALWIRTRASAVRPENASVVFSSIGTILRIVRGSWSLLIGLYGLVVVK